jgi:hypothetical protein
MSPPLGSLRLERISLTSAFFVLAYVLIFFAFSRVGLVDGRNVLAIAGASAGAWGLLHVTRSPRAFVHVARRVGSRRAFRLGRWPAPGRKHRGGVDTPVAAPGAWIPVSLVPFRDGTTGHYPHIIERAKPGTIGVDHCRPGMCSATSGPVAERPAYTRREIDYPAIVPSLAVTGCGRAADRLF